MNKKEAKNQLNKMYLCRMYYGYILFNKTKLKIK